MPQEQWRLVELDNGEGRPPRQFVLNLNDRKDEIHDLQRSKLFRGMTAIPPPTQDQQKHLSPDGLASADFPTVTSET
ncbi:hypothetical protein HYZ99_02075 [Candidatus Peregrinibacteria bacterium]|nr:hypothetical protein [Candidatus Peregrinibacteria bacterium]